MVGRILNAAQSSILYDRDDTNFYVDPNNTSVFNHTWSTINYDRDDTAYYSDPNWWSNVNVLQGNDIRSGVFYDKYDTYYLLQPRWWSRINALHITGDTVAPWPDDGDDLVTKDYVDNRLGSISGLVVGGCLYDGGSTGEAWGAGVWHKVHKPVPIPPLLCLNRATLYQLLNFMIKKSPLLSTLQQY